tara:strand:- start:566 stop:814 length:249 start_codon:yes stop_codon:yes gene_type:complete
MPNYAYRCVECMSQFNAFHGFNERTNCPTCFSSVCERIPSVGFSVSGYVKEQESKTGEKVKDFIEQSREELKQQREELEDER